MTRIVSKLQHYYTALGARGVVAFCFAKLRRKTPIFSVTASNIKFPIYVRLATTDVAVLKQVLIEKHYNFPLQFSPQTIVDAGANIGLSAVFFANRFPEAKIVAIEPEASNFELLLLNTARYPNIKPIHAALWHSEGSISLLDPGSGNHGFQTSDSPTEKSAMRSLVPATTIAAIMRDSDWRSLDLLKLDIEGSEKEIFDTCLPWINSVHAIMAELHDDLKPGCTASFREASRTFKDGGQCGESVMVFRG